MDFLRYRILTDKGRRLYYQAGIFGKTTSKCNCTLIHISATKSDLTKKDKKDSSKRMMQSPVTT